jgi:MFS family permease
MPHDSPRAWPQATVIAAVVAIVTGVSALLLLDGGLDRSRPTIEAVTAKGAQAVGQAVAGQIGHALDVGIPLDRLVGVAPYLDEIVSRSPQVRGLALIDANGRTLYATMSSVTGLKFPIGSTGQATLLVEPQSLLIDSSLDMLDVALLIAAVLTGAVGGAVVAGYLAFHRRPLRRNLEHALDRIAAGDFSTELPVEGRGRHFEATQAIQSLIEKIEAARLRLSEQVATIRAIDFDGSLGQRVDLIVEPLDRRYVLSSAESDRVSRSGPLGEGVVVWRLAVLLGLYGAGFPLVANFAMDREPGEIARAWWPVLPLLAELAAVALGAWLGAGRLGRVRTLLFMAALLLGAVVAGTYWCHDYDTFVLLRAAAGFGAGFLGAGVVAGSGLDIDRRDFLVAVVFSALLAGPAFGSLLTEAVGRRAAFLAIGVAILAAAPFIAIGYRRMLRQPARASVAFRADLMLGLALAPAAALVLVEVPSGLGVENYILTAGVIALIGFSALVAPSLPVPVAAGALLAVALAVAGWPTLDPLIALLVVAAAAGLAGGGVIKNLGASSRRPWPAAALASGAALIATGAVHYLDLPFIIVPGAAAALLLATHLAAGRTLAVRYAG